MINHQNSRRSFLGSLAILTVGSAFGSAARLLPDSTAPEDLKALWKQFCLRCGGHHTSVQTSTETVLPSKGHWHEDGSVVSFPQHNLQAQPTWIYWSENKRKPADVVVTFYENNDTQKKLFRLNRFECEAFLQLPADEQGQDILALVKESCQYRSGKNQPARLQPLKVKVRKGRQVAITTRLSAQEFCINKNFTYQV